MQKIPLKFSDTELGTDEFGYIPALPGEDPDDADRRYVKHLAAQGIRARVDRMGNLVVEGPASSTTRRRMDEADLRRMVRRELQALSRRR